MAHKKWSKKDYHRLLKLLNIIPNREIAKIFDTNEKVISNIQSKLGISKLKQKKENKKKESVYVVESCLRITQTFHIYESKLNYMI